ncbi:carboxymuconolactone decarboxylase [Roseivirga seohaensis subsp. aquiponti]|uniref:Carboxymuconolactone decarboxylase n=1 Tax=Roseivirga seohaensis subsp. aquiponti TaxID=1566026 RepID=A0A0L8AP01_9BACT|nr:carboxymuconolactone decarboxylase family protein [Roseivirga seohaensis]KOF03960.1 carboxymuconolactone decarboxylase [Roseivirga seohaensis subsp. aquiponti]
MQRFSHSELPNGLYAAAMGVETYLSNCGLDHGLLELMRFRISQINHCVYCLDMHYKEAIAAGETELKLYSISAWREAPYYSNKERAVLSYAEKLTLLSQNEVSDEDIENLGKFFSRKEIANLTLAIAQINTWNRLMDAFRFEPGKHRVNQK